MKDEDAVHGLNNTLQTLCPCGCGRLVRNVKNRNGRMKMFFDDKCRGRWYGRAREIGKGILEKRKQQEFIDLDAMLPQERLGALVRFAEKMGILK